MKDTNFYVVHGWMVNKLELKGNPLLVFAVIYGFSQDNESKYNGSLKYLMSFTNASKNTVRTAIEELLERELIIKFSYVRNSVTFCEYSQNEPVVQKLIRGGANSDSPGSNSDMGGGAIPGHNTNNSITKHNNSINNGLFTPEEQPAATVFNFKKSLVSCGADEKLATDWLAVRKLKRLAPTETAFDGFMAEFRKTGADINDVLRVCITKGWGGFEKKWYDNYLKTESENGGNTTNGSGNGGSNKVGYEFDFDRATEAATFGNNK